MSPHDSVAFGPVQLGEEAFAVSFHVQFRLHAFAALPRVARSGFSSAQEVECGSEFFLSSGSKPVSWRMAAMTSLINDSGPDSINESTVAGASSISRPSMDASPQRMWM